MRDVFSSPGRFKTWLAPSEWGGRYHRVASTNANRSFYHARPPQQGVSTLPLTNERRHGQTDFVFGAKLGRDSVAAALRADGSPPAADRTVTQAGRNTLEPDG